MKQLVEQLWARVGDRVDNLVLLEEVDSTHALALRLVDQMDDIGLALCPTVVLALSQSQGRGRGSNRWASPPGGLYLSLLRSGLSPAATSLLPLVAATATAAAVASLGLETVVIRWPNDLLVGEAKLAGILTHARHGSPPWATVGIGVNLSVTPTDDLLAGRLATSVADHLPVLDPLTATVQLVGELVVRFEAGLADPDQTRAEWGRRLVHRTGEAMAVRLGSGEVVAGTFAGLTDEGFLRLSRAAGERVISSGELVERSGASA